MRRSDSTHLSQGRPGHQRAAAALLGTLLAATGLTTAQATGDITAPTVQVTSPAPDQLFKLGSLTFQGSAGTTQASPP